MVRESEARIRFSVFNEDYRKGIKEINDENRRMKNEFKLTEAQMKNNATESDKLHTRIQRLGNEKENVTRKIKLTEEQLEKAKDVYGENSTEAQKLSDDLVRLQTSEQRLENAIQDTSRKLRDHNEQLANAEAEEYAKKIKNAGESVEKFGKKLQEQGKHLSAFGKAWTMRVSAPLLAAAGAALKVGMDFEEGMSKVQAISGATGEDLEKLSVQARDLGANTRFSATEAASGMEFLAMAGFETNEIMSAMPGLLDLAASSNMDLGRAADIASNIISGFAYEASEAGRVADVLAKGASSANTNVEQLGDAMATVAPVASALGLDVEGLTAAVGFMSDAGIQGSQAGRMLRQGILRLASPTGAAADLIEDLGINVFDSEGNMKELHEVVDELSTGLDGMSSQAQTAALSTMFGAQSVAGWTALIGRGSKDLETFTRYLEASEGAASDMAKTMQDNTKGAIIELKSALEGAGIELAQHMIPVVTHFVKNLTDMVRKFGELDEEQQKQIIKWGLIAIAVGPVASTLGKVFTVTGSLVSGTGALIGKLGTAKGAGLIGKFALMGASAGPVVLAAGSVGLLGLAIYGLTRDMSESTEEIYKSMVARREELDEIDNLIDAYEELHEKNQLTTDQMLRYMDILTELEEAESEEAIKKLTEQQEELLKWSGLTREEMEEYLKLNDTLVEKMPTVVDAISDQGNAYISVIDNVKDLNEVERQRFLDDTYVSITNEMRDQEKNLIKQAELQQEISILEFDRVGIYERMTGWNERIREIDKELLDLEEQKVGATSERLDEIHRTEVALGLERDGMVHQIQLDKERVAEIEKQISGKQKTIEEIEQELDYYKMLIEDYEQMLLLEYGITSEKGKTNEALKEAQDQLDKNKKELQELVDLGEISVDEFAKQNRELRDQQALIDEAKERARSLNETLSEEINKNVRATVTPSPTDINWQLSQPVNKKIQAQGYGFRALGYKDGTNYHPGGPALVGEEGPELVKYRNKYELLTFGLHNLKRGSKVYTAKQTEQAFKKGRVPSYAGGVGNNVTPRLSDISESLASFRESQINNNVVVIVQPSDVNLDNEQVGRIQWRVVKDHIDRDNETIRSFQGG